MGIIEDYKKKKGWNPKLSYDVIESIIERPWKTANESID